MGNGDDDLGAPEEVKTTPSTGIGASQRQDPLPKLSKKMADSLRSPLSFQLLETLRACSRGSIGNRFKVVKGVVPEQ